MISRRPTAEASARRRRRKGGTKSIGRASKMCAGLGKQARRSCMRRVLKGGRR